MFIFANKMKKLLLVEHKVGRAVGHFQTTPHTFLHLTKNFRFFLLSDKKVELTDREGNPIEQLQFKGTPKYYHTRPRRSLKFSYFRDRAYFKLGLFHAAEERVFEVAEKFGLDHDDHILVPSAQDKIFSSIINHMDKVLSNKNAHFPALPIVHLRVSSDSFSKINDLGPFVSRLKNLMDLEKVKIHCETIESIEELKRKYQLRIEREPMQIPYNISPFLPDTLQTTCNRIENSFRLAHLGGARHDKGSHRIAGIVKHLRKLNEKQPTDACRISIAVQLDLDNPAPLYEELATLPLSEHNVRIDALGSSLSTQNFIDQCHLCDAFLLPYVHHGKRTTGSGLIMDAVFAKKPIFCPPGMTMEHFLGFGNGICAVSDEDFAKKILKIANEPQNQFESNVTAAYNYAEKKVTKQLEL